MTTSDPDLTWTPPTKRRKSPARLPGERHNFHNLTPPQHLTAAGRIESARPTEVVRGEDPLLARIRALETERDQWKLRCLLAESKLEEK